MPEILLHVSRGVRWDSDHVVILNDDLLAIAQEMVRGDYLGRVAHRAGLFRRQHQPRRSVDDRHAQHAPRPAAAPCSSRTPNTKLEGEGDFTSRLALMEEAKTLPFGAVWDYYCGEGGAGRGGVAGGSQALRKKSPEQSAMTGHPNCNPFRHESIPGRLLSLAGRPGLRQFLRPLQRRQEMVVGNLLAGRRVVLVDHLPVVLASLMTTTFRRAQPAIRSAPLVDVFLRRDVGFRRSDFRIDDALLGHVAGHGGGAGLLRGVWHAAAACRQSVFPKIPVAENIIQIASSASGQITFLGVFVCLLGIAIGGLRRPDQGT